MLEAQSVFAGIVAVCAIFTYLTYRRLGSREQARHEKQYDPIIYVAGPEEQRWQLAPNNIKHIWKRDLYICNPGTAPVLIRSWQYRSSQTGNLLPLAGYEKGAHAVETPLQYPVLIDGYGGRRITFKLEGNFADSIHIVYSTSMQEEKVLTIPVMLAEIEEPPE